MADRQSGASRPTSGRVPPHNLDAEASVLGAMLLSRDAIASAVEILESEHFYKPAHGHIFDAIVSLYSAGEPADPVTVADELGRAGLLDAVGGAAALVSLQTSTPAISNAARYARIIEEHALLRKLISVAGEIAEIAYERPDDVTKAVDSAESMIYNVAERRVTDSVQPLRDLLDRSLDRLEQLYERGESITGLPTGYLDLDELLSGLQPSALVVVGARPSMGKCVAWDTPVLDPCTGAIRLAAEVYRLGTSGEQVQVVSLGPGGFAASIPSAFVDDGVKPVFRVRTASGREIRTTASHPFLTERGWLPLAELTVGVRVAVPRALPYFGDEVMADDEIALLAHLVAHADTSDGTVVFTNTTPGVLADLRVAATAAAFTALDATGHRYRVVPGRHDRVAEVAGRNGMLGTPRGQTRIPDAVYRLARPQLAAFLRRLFGIAGAARPAARGAGRVHLATRSAALAHGLAHLLRRFDISVHVNRRHVDVADEEGFAYDVEIVEPVALQRFCSEIGIHGHDADIHVLARRAGDRRSTAPAAPVRAGLGGLGGLTAPLGPDVSGPVTGPLGGGRAPGQVLERPTLGRGALQAIVWDDIVEIAYDGRDQVYDLTVPGTHNFVAGDIVVHNTAFALGMAAQAAVESNRPVLFFSLEMGHLEITQRLLCAEAKVPSERLRNGRLLESDWPKISHAVGRLAEATLWIDDNPHLTVMEIRAKARRLKSRVGDLGLVVVDYLQLMSGRSGAENRQVEVSEISRGLKILARELETPVIALSQLSRALEVRADKRPMLSDLRESGSIEQDADVVMFIYRDEVYNPDTSDAGVAEIHIAKHRNGPIGTVRLAFLGHYTKFANMARGM